MFQRMWFDANGDGGNGNGDGQKPEDQKPPEAKFTQADLDRILGERVKRAEETTKKQLLEALDVKDSDEAKKAIADAKALREQQMSDLEKANAKAAELEAAKAEAEAKAVQAIEKANATLMRAAVLAEASKAEYRFKAEALPDVWAFVKREGIKPKEGADGEFTGIGEALKALAKEKAYLVLEGDGRGTPRPGTRKLGDQKKEEPRKGFTL